MKDSKIEWVGEVPEHWIKSKIKYCFKIINGATPSGSNQNYWDGDIAWITPADMPNIGYVNCGKRFITLQGYRSCGTTIVPTGSIIISSRAPIGKVCLSSKPLCTNQGCKSLLRYQDNSFYFYFMIAAQEEMCIMGRGTTFMELSTMALENIELIFPPLSEQKAIAEYLDEKCGEIDALLADIKEEIETLEQYKRSVITESVTKGLDPSAPMKNSGIEWVGEIPEHWATHPLYHYFSERKRKNLLGKETNLLSLSYGKVIRKDINTSEGLLPENYNGYNIVECDDIVLRLTDLQNDKRSLRTGLIKERGIITSAYVTIKPIKQIDSSFFHYILHAYDIMKVFYNMGNGVRQGLNYDELCKCKLIAAPLSEQQEIAEYLDKKCAEIDAVISDKQSQIETLESYKKSLIY